MALPWRVRINMALAPEPLRKMFRLIGDDRAMLAEIIESFLQETPALVEKLRAAVLTKNMESAGMTAHSLKSTAHDMGAIAFSSMCRDVELNCRSRSDLPSDNKLNELEQESKLVIADLNRTLLDIKNGTWADDK
jgi:histidine phosphotransfer protein HptB